AWTLRRPAKSSCSGRGGCHCDFTLRIEDQDLSRARDAFIDASRTVFMAPGDEAGYAKLSEAADLWRADGEHFSAGVAMSRAAYSAWGQPERMAAAQSA